MVTRVETLSFVRWDSVMGNSSLQSASEGTVISNVVDFDCFLCWSTWPLEEVTDADRFFIYF